LGEPIIRLIYERGQFDHSIDEHYDGLGAVRHIRSAAGYAAIKNRSPLFTRSMTRNGDSEAMLSTCFNLRSRGCQLGSMMKLLSTVSRLRRTTDGFGHVGVAWATSSVALVNFSRI
jgi:hypothetical protein